jgi:hypothetical protein
VECYAPSGPMGMGVRNGTTLTGLVSIDWRFGDEREPLCPPSLPPLPPGSVTISGPDMVMPSSVCYYQGDVTSGTGPYTYRWYQNTTLVGTAADVVVDATGYSSYTLRLDVTDTNGQQGSHSMSITVNSNAFECFS